MSYQEKNFKQCLILFCNWLIHKFSLVVYTVIFSFLTKVNLIIFFYLSYFSQIRLKILINLKYITKHLKLFHKLNKNPQSAPHKGKNICHLKFSAQKYVFHKEGYTQPLSKQIWSSLLAVGSKFLITRSVPSILPTIRERKARFSAFSVQVSFSACNQINTELNCLKRPR